MTQYPVVCLQNTCNSISSSLPISTYNNLTNGVSHQWGLECYLKFLQNNQHFEAAIFAHDVITFTDAILKFLTTFDQNFASTSSHRLRISTP